MSIENITFENIDTQKETAIKTASHTLIRLYDAFNIDAFKLQYKVQKLSKRARRNQI